MTEEGGHGRRGVPSCGTGFLCQSQCDKAAAIFLHFTRCQGEAQSILRVGVEACCIALDDRVQNELRLHAKND